VKILLSGASSFTGYWFGRTLAARGHQVTGVFRQPSVDDYEGLRKQRVTNFLKFAQGSFDSTFGSTGFLDVAQSDRWDVYCHHASDVTNYRSADFDPISATQRNTHFLASVLQALGQAHCQRVVFTGSIFEGGEGAGSDNLPHISRYGLSKALSWEIFLFECREMGFQLDKFVIPNPFGPYEEPRFTNYLVQQWKQGHTADVRTPDYIRDNIHVELLALEYADFVESQAREVPPRKCHPSGYIESQGQFALRFATEFEQRSGWKCPVEFSKQTEFPEPVIRINTQPSALRQPDWCESSSWDQVAEYYLERHSN
jgi:UDP-glucose 4-epimerase